MDPRVYTPAYELFFVLEPLRASFFELRRLLLPLNGPEAPRLLGTDLYYREATDVALLALRFDERQLDHRRMTWVLQLAAGAGLPVLDPVRLSEDDRRAFYTSYLADYELRAESFADVDGALCELGERLELLPPRKQARRAATQRRAATATWPVQIDDGGEKTRDGPPPAPPPPPRLARMATVTPPPIPVRDTLPKTPPPTSTSTDVRIKRLGSSPPPAQTPGPRGALGKLAPEHRSPRERQAMSLAEQAAAARARSPRARARTVKAPLLLADSGPTRRRPARETLNARGKKRARSHERAATRPSVPGAKGITAARRAHGSGPHPALDDAAPGENAIDVRFLRGGQWVPAALRTLSAKSAYLVTGAPPRVGDSVYIALGYRDHGAMVRATVHHVTTPEDAEETGSSGFAARFPVADSPGRQQLIELLRRARSDGVTIKPPPSRCAVRFPVEWPVRIGTPQGGLGVDALDVSSGGMFVATESMLPAEAALMFRIPLDTGVEGVGVKGRARIVRKVSTEQASARGLRPGYGLAFLDLAADDERRYHGFLSRVRQRNERRILVGAAPGRVEELSRELSAVGYAVTAGSDPGALLRLADSEPTPPDVAIIDVSLQTRGLRKSWVEQVFTARSVPCITTRGEAPSRARLVVDRLLQVGG